MRRYVSKFLHESLVDVSAIERTYDYLNPEERIRVYYKANLHKFLLNNKIRNVYAKISGSKCDFVDPNNIPDEIYPEVILLSELVTEFVNYKHSMFRYEDRTKYQKRSSVLVIDTDS